ncbi:hypothetical protein Ssi03_62010 [Sphaerisporangium siamense]|uniref:Uncharacterized protein n=1 Tax=Sphaerisporangium siamense TaxID=795645 RepID=A0A7W7D929_9ACTN|nr:hypothetical protein [Sphaerisporangium siamense]MBB4702512.1 hypothetical protein [Sphaerisporangium siamense]GII88211.1 hypothetical protein Ssi03_62010 [Sphaerisporangium siamense]
MIGCIVAYLRMILARRPSADRFRPHLTTTPTRTPDFEAAMRTICRGLETDDLIRRRDRGFELGGVLPAPMAAIDAVLRERGVQICPCGASPNRPHTRTCKEA